MTELHKGEYVVPLDAIKNMIRENVRRQLDQAWVDAGLLNDNNPSMGDDYVEYHMTIWVNKIRLGTGRRLLEWYNDVREPWVANMHTGNLYFDKGFATEELVDFFYNLIYKE